MKKILLVDGHSILNRAFYGIPELTNIKGVHTNAVYGFINILLKAIEEEKAEYTAVAFDLKDPTFRHKMYEEYKGTRKPMPAELHEQVPIIKEALSRMKIPVITLSGYEADDILGTLAKRCQADECEVVILSGDRDLLQLADTHIKIRLPKTIKGKTEVENYYPADVEAKYSVTPKQFIDLKALMGDSSDNIPGVPGIGEKTATAIITKYKSIEEAYANVDDITPTKARNNLSEHYDMAVMSKKLATIDIDAPVDFDINQAYNDNFYTKEAYELFKELELNSLLKKFDESQMEVADTTSDGFTMTSNTDEVENTVRLCKENKKAGVALAICEGKLYGVAFSTGAEHNVFVPCRGFITEAYLRDTLNELSHSTHLYVIDLKSQLDFIRTDINADIDDVSIIAYLLNPLRDKYNYENIAEEFLNAGFKGVAELSAKRSIETLFNEDIDTLMKIFCYEAYTAYMSADIVKNRLEEEQMLKIYEEIELPLIYVLRGMEREGIRVNKEDLKQYGDELVGRIEKLEQNIYKSAGEEFNINSPKQLGVILFEKLGLPNGKKTKTGYSTSADILEKLADEYPIVNDILEYRTLAKLKSTYADGLADYIKEDGRIHSTFNQTITATGRISSTEPNLQNIPIRMELGRLIRKVFIPKDGYSFMDADYSQIELRLLAHMSADETLIQAYKEDSDIHRITASKVFKIPLEEVTSTQRSNAKAVNFGIVYGISSFGLSKDLSISKQEAKEYIEEYFNTYPSIKNYLDRLVEEAKKLGYSETLYGRRRPVPELSSGNFMQRQFGERIAMNSPLQGTAADIIKIAMINVYKRIEREQLESKLILQIHDELLIETARGEEEAVHRILEEEMTGAAKLLVPLETDIHAGSNWYEAK